MKISIYTYFRNVIYLDFHAVHMLKHHLQLADEIVVNEGFSDDGTYEAIKDIDPRIKIHRRSWADVKPGMTWWCILANEARARCTGDWCIKLDADEFIPEWEFDRIRLMIANTKKNLFGMRLKNFYGNYKVLQTNPERLRWPAWKQVIHRNLPQVTVIGDGTNVKVGDEPYEEIPADATELHHFGFVRRPARLRQKWRNQTAINSEKPHFDHVPGFVYDLRPHDWIDKDLTPGLVAYEGPYVRAVQDDPDEFVRDKMMMYDWVKKQL